MPATIVNCNHFEVRSGEYNMGERPPDLEAVKLVASLLLPLRGAKRERALQSTPVILSELKGSLNISPAAAPIEKKELEILRQAQDDRIAAPIRSAPRAGSALCSAIASTNSRGVA